MLTSSLLWTKGTLRIKPLNLHNRKHSLISKLESRLSRRRQLRTQFLQRRALKLHQSQSQQPRRLRPNLQLLSHRSSQHQRQKPLQVLLQRIHLQLLMEVIFRFKIKSNRSNLSSKLSRLLLTRRSKRNKSLIQSLPKSPRQLRLRLQLKPQHLLKLQPQHQLLRQLLQLLVLLSRRSKRLNNKLFNKFRI